MGHTSGVLGGVGISHLIAKLYNRKIYRLLLLFCYCLFLMFLQSTSCTCNPRLSCQIASSVKNPAINLGRKLKKKAFEQPQWMAKAQPQSRALGDGGRAPLLSVLALEDFSELETAGTPELL